MSAKLEILFLSDEQVLAMGAGDMSMVMQDVKEALSLFEKGEVIYPFKVIMRKNDDPAEEFISGRINAMPAYVGGSYDMAGIKWAGGHPENYKRGLPRASAIGILNDPISKLPLCVMEATPINTKRTGAVGGLAAQYLARKGAKVLTIIGAGAQGRTQAEAIVSACPSIENIYVYDIRLEASQQFAKEMGEMLKKPIIALSDPEEACRKSDIISTATMSKTPIVQKDWLKEGVLCINIGGVEYTREASGLCNRIVVDDWKAIKHRFSAERLVETFPQRVTDADYPDAQLGEIINGTKPARQNDKERIFFKAVGMAVEDVAVMAHVYKNAQAHGVGTKVTYWED